MNCDVVTFSFKAEGPKVNGQSVPSGSDIPTFKGALSTDAQLLAKLDTALEYLSETPCAYFACEGPRRPRNMCTCCKCWAMREVAMVRAAIARRTP